VSAPPTPSPRDAAVFLPALSSEWTDQSLETMARRMTVGLERSAPPVAKFVAKLGSHSATYGDGLKAGVATISEVMDNLEERPLLDVYGFDYHRPLTGPFAKRSLLITAAALGAMMAYSIAKLLAALRRRRAKRKREILQLWFGVFILLLFCAYAGIIVVALVQTIFGVLGTGQETVSIPQTVVLIGAALGFALPKLRVAISTAAVDYLGATMYLAFGFRKQLLTGQLQALLEHIAEHDRPTYRHVHIIGYSFGSVIALDTLFPKGTSAPKRASSIQTIITIGCPFDMIRTYLRKYFRGRKASSLCQRWWNIHDPVDILSSDFKGDGAAIYATLHDDHAGSQSDPPGPVDELQSSEIMPGSNTARVKPNELIEYNPFGSDKISLLGLFVLEGLRAHVKYWDESVDAESCFTPIMERLYTQMLGEPAQA
jgi:hypothetical protein